MLRTKLRIAAIAGIAAMTLSISTAAMAADPKTPGATPEGIVGQVNPVATTNGTASVVPLVNTVCDYGTYLNQGSNALSNGTLSAAFCHYAGSHGVSQVNIEYKKTGGTTSTLRFGWEFTDAGGSSSYSRQYDNGWFTENSGETKTFTWHYVDPGIRTPTQNAPCVRGVLQQQSGSSILTFTTAIVCGL